MGVRFRTARSATTSRVRARFSAIAASCRKPSSPSVAAAISSLRRSRKSRLARGSLRKMRRPLRQRCAPSVNLPRLLGACPLGLGALLLAAVLIGWRVLAPHAPPKADLPYVVVVPFDVSSDAPEVWQPFADQVTREVIRNLRKISGLRVVPTPSAFTFRDNKSTEHIRRQLPDVQYVLDGVVSVAADNSLRIIAELEDLNQRRLVWDKDFEGRIDDTNFFAMQSGIAAAVSASLKVVILKDEQRALSELPTTNLKAYECTWRDVRRWSCSVMSPCLAPLISSARPSRWTRNSSPRISPEAMPTARCLPTSSRHQNTASGGFFDLRGAGAAPRFRRGALFARPDLCDGLALEGCVDRAECSEIARPDAGADGTGFCAVLLRPRRSGKGEELAGRRQPAGPAQS
jgi:TolB-like protein